MHIFNILKKSIFLLSLPFFFNSCAVSRFALHQFPSTTDHNVFPCDTVQHNPQNTVALFPKAANEQLPNPEYWLPASALVEGTSKEAILRNSGSQSLIVVHKGEVIYEAYADEQAAQRPQMVFSITKAFMAVLSHIAQEEGYWTLDQPIGDFIPQFNKEEYKAITIQHLLDMNTGMKWSDEDNLYKMGRFYYNNHIDRFSNKTAEFIAQPGERFNYASINTQLLTTCMEKAIGKKPSIYLEEKIWKVINMQDNGLFTMDSKKGGNVRGFGGLAVSPRDMLRFGKLLLQNGRWEGKQIVSTELLSSLKTRHLDKEQWWGYSNCFWRNGYNNANVTEMTSFYAAGHLGQFIYVDQENDLLIVRTGHKQPFKWAMAVGRLAQLITAGENNWSNTKMPMLEQFAGVYEGPEGLRFELRADKEFIGNKKSVNEYRRSWEIVHLEGPAIPHLPKKLDRVYDFDEYSLGFRKLSMMIRFVAKEVNGELQGVYLDDRIHTRPVFFKKVQNVMASSKQ